MALELNSANFQNEILNHKGAAIVDFWAPWCGPCRMMGPVLESLSAKYNGQVKVAKVNVDECPDLAAQFQVSSIPMIVFFKDGKPVYTSIGAKPEPALEAEIKQHLL